MKIKEKLLLMATFVAFSTVSLILFTPTIVVYADEATCESSGGTWNVAYEGRDLVGRCTNCPSDKVVSDDSEYCVQQELYGKAPCEASGGAWNVAYQGSTLRGTCSCPAGKDVNSRGTVCVDVDADTGDPVGSGEDTLELDGEGQKVFDIIQTGINLLTALTGIAITGAVIFAGVQYSTSGGNPQAAAQAKSRITNAVIALFCLVFLFAFFQWLVPGGIFG